MQENVIIQLIDRYLEGTATQVELNELDQWYNSFNNRTGLYICDNEDTKNAARDGFAELKARLKSGDNT